MKKGFTLIEMAVVLLIIGILAGIVLRNIGGQSIQARDAKRVGDLRILTNYLAQYLNKQGQFPASSSRSSENWSGLKEAFERVNMNINLPQPSAGDPYEYWACSDVGSTTINHFILRTRLEQNATEAPRVYEGTYDSATLPSGWRCAGLSDDSLNCSKSERYYCITQ
jgi:prepilin-type N-terminal cleavage/methylation domain-containing protein